MSNKVTTLSFTVEPAFVKKLEQLISKTGLYHSKSEFLRDAARQRMIQMLGIEEEYKNIHEGILELRKKAKFREISAKERNGMAREYAKRKEW